MKPKDPIIEELHKFREDFAREHNYDIKRIARAFQDAEAASGRKVVTLEPRRTQRTKRAS